MTGGGLSLEERRAAGLAPPAPGALTTGIVDIHHADGRYDLTAAKAGGIVALIHKATEGGDFVDKGYVRAAVEAKRAGMLFALYHFANGNDPTKQADHFLAHAKDHPEALLILDIEKNDRSTFGTMTLAQAVTFVERVHVVTGRWPVFYTYSSMLAGMMRGATDAQRAVLARCPLWIAAYGPDPRKLRVPAPWPTFAMHQYTNGSAGPVDRATYPRQVPGFARAAQDRSVFFGTPDDLAVWWKTAGIL